MLRCRRRCRAGIDEGDDAAAEAGAGEAGTVHASAGECRLDERVDFGRADLVVVAHAAMRFDHQPAERRQVAALQRVGGALHAIVLRDHVAAASINPLVEPRLWRGQARRRDGALGPPAVPHASLSARTPASQSARRCVVLARHVACLTIELQISTRTLLGSSTASLSSERVSISNAWPARP